MGDGFLHRYFLNNGGKRLHKWVHYFDIYERHLERFRGTDVVMIEIGVMGGGSLAMWREYLGDKAQIVGVDINPACKKHEAPGIEIYIGSQDDPTLLASIMAKYSRIDVVLDDGSHINRHMIKTFETLYPAVHERGVYLVEDTHTCYWEDYGGGLRREGSFIEFVKDKIDELNAFHSRGRDVLVPTDFTKATSSISIYDSVVVCEKRPQGTRIAPITGDSRFLKDA